MLWRVGCLGVVLAFAGPGPAGAEPKAEDAKILLATTTSVRDSGLLDTLVPDFEKRTGIAVQVVAVGTGAALRMGAEGNADVLLTHAPEAEQEAVAAGALVDRRPFMQNYFVIAGPPEDPAGVAAAASPEDALRRIADRGAPFVSRADDSGTHKREVALFEAAGLDPKADREGLTRTGTGMGLSLQVAGERRAYVLSDLGTFLAFQERTGLVALSRPAPSLRNVYSVLRVSPERFAGRIHADGAARFAAFLLEPDVQRRIGEFGRERFGRPLFTPLVAASPAP
jgi:tungstate transport system substrate-binding protein